MRQTETTQAIMDITAGFEKQGLGRVFEILNWIHKNLKRDSDEEYKSENFRKRTAEEIINSGKLTGCTDYALVFLALVGVSGLEAKYVEAIETEWLKNGGDHIKGHVFAEVKLEDEWVIVDPESATLRAWYGKRYEIFAKGEDSWDIGIYNMEELKQKFLDYKSKFEQNGS